MHKHNLILMIIVSLFLSFIFNIQFTSQEVYAQSSDNVTENVDPERVSSLIERAKKHLERGRLINAQTTLQLLLLKVEKDNFEAQLMLSDVYMKRIPYVNQETRAELKEKIAAFLKTALEKYPDNKQCNMLAAKFYRDSFDLTNAIKYAMKIYDAEPGNFDALLILADSNLYSGEDTEALKYYELARKLQPDNADILIALLDLNTEETELTKILELAEKVYMHEKIPASVKSDYCIDTAVRAFTTDYKIAQKFMQYAIELQPSLIYRLMKSAMKYDAVKTNFDEKLQFIEAARVDISPENSLREIKDISDKIVPEVNVLNAILFYHIDEFEKAYESIKKAQAFDTDEFPEFKEYEAYIAEMNDDLDLTLSCFKALLTREPDVNLYKTKIAMLERMQTKLSEVIDDDNKKSLLAKMFTAYRLYFNNLLDSMKSPEDKLTGFTKALESDPQNPWIAKEKGYLELNNAFDYKNAHQTYKIAYFNLVDDSSVMLNLAISAMLDETNKDYALADEILIKLRQKYPNDFLYKKYTEILNSIKADKIKVQAYGLYYKAAYADDFMTRLETCEKAIMAQENLYEPLLLWGKINVDSASRIMQNLRQYNPESEEYKAQMLKVDELLATAETSIKQAIGNARNEDQRNEGLLELADLQANNEQLEEALITLDSCINAPRPSSDALLLAMNLQLQLKMNTAAHLNAAKLINNYPDHPFLMFENNNMYYDIDKSKYMAETASDTKEIIQPKFELGKTYRYHINLNLKGWSGENSEMNIEIRVAAKIIDIPTPGFYKFEFEVLCIRGTDMFDDLFDKTYIVEMSDILGICSFLPQSEKDNLKIQTLSRFLGFVMPYVTEMFAYAPSNMTVKPGECWVKRTQGGMLHFSDSNEASFIADSNDKSAKIVRLSKSGNEFAGELANFNSELTFDKTKNLATEMTFDYWSLIPDSLDDTRQDRMEARTFGSIKLTLVK